MLTAIKKNRKRVLSKDDTLFLFGKKVETDVSSIAPF